MNEYFEKAFKPAQIRQRLKELEKVEMFRGRPERNTVISKDEITNLRITLEITNSVTAFLRAV